MNNELPFVVYSNTSYLDVLNIQTDYIKNITNKILLIDENSLKLELLYSKYDKVIFYNNNDTYATRIYNCFNKIEEKYVLFTHDIDILLNINQEYINNMYNFLLKNNYDRIDLKYTNKIENKTLIDYNNFTITNEIIDNNVYLIKQDKSNDYIYNVNPSIWKVETIIDIMSNFKHKTYRTIEDLDVQYYSLKYNIFKLYSTEYKKCGYFECLDIYKFLHISHGGRLLKLTPEYKTVYGQSYSDICNEYTEIVNKYNLINSEKY